jgi:hypothetical protein
MRSAYRGRQHYRRQKQAFVSSVVPCDARQRSQTDPCQHCLFQPTGPWPLKRRIGRAGRSHYEVGHYSSHFAVAIALKYPKVELPVTDKSS